MSVLCEALSVIVTHSALEVAYPGGGEGYRRDCPNGTYCADDYLTRVGFMHPDDVGAFIDAFVRRTGLVAYEHGRFVDLAVIDQFSGPTGACDWLDFKRSGEVTRAWLSGTPEGDLATPDGWAGPGAFRFHTFEEAEGMALTAPVGGLQQTISSETGETEYVGRIAQGPAGVDEHFRSLLRRRQEVDDARGALEVCSAWTEQRPTSPTAWYELGVAAFAIRRFDLAEDACRRTISLAPDHEEALANLGAALVNLGRSGEARSWLERALELDPGDPVALFYVGQSQLVAGEEQSALESLRRAVSRASERRMEGAHRQAARLHDELTARLLGDASEGTEDADVEFCSACGQVMGWTCDSCGEYVCDECAPELSDGTTLCPACLASVPAEATTEPPVPPINVAAKTVVACPPAQDSGAERRLRQPHRGAAAAARDDRVDSLTKVVSGLVTAAALAWELWLIVAVWRGGRLPVPFTDWTTMEGHPFAAVLLLVFGTPFVGAAAFTVTMAVASPLRLAFQRPHD